MTVQDKPRREVKIGNGTTGPYSFDFQVLLEANVKVSQFTIATGALVLEHVFNSDYTVALDAGTGPRAGDVTSTVAIPATDHLVLEGDTKYLQDTDYVKNDPFPADVNERALDRLTMLAQQLRDDVSRSLTLPVNSTITELSLPNPEAGKILRWLTDLSGFENVDLVGSGSIAIPVTIAQGGHGTTTLGAAQTALGILTSISLANTNQPIPAAIRTSLFKLL